MEIQMETITVEREVLFNAYNHSAILYALIDALALSILVSLIVRMRVGLEKLSVRKAFAIMAGSVSAMIILDLTCNILEKSHLRVFAPLIVLSIMKSLFFIVSTLTGFCTFLAMEHLFITPISCNRRLIIYTLAPSFLHIILNLTNPFHGLYFKYSENLIYTYGPLYAFEYIVPFSYILFSSLRAILSSRKEENYADAILFKMIASVPVLPIIFSIAQLIFDVPVLGIGLSLTLLNLYLAVIQNSITSDPLTGLSNRRYLLRTIQRMMNGNEGKKTHFVMMMDINYFKQVNDIFGHTAGDRALIRLSVILKRATTDLRRITLARYGGDEFIICGELDNREEIENLRSSIRKLIDEDNIDAEFPLSVSIGYATYDSSIKNTKQFIDMADADLYDQKEEAHKKPCPYK